MNRHIGSAESDYETAPDHLCHNDDVKADLAIGTGPAAASSKPADRRTAILTISDAEQKILIENGLDPRRIRLYRARLELKQPYPSRLVKAKMVRLEKLLDSADRIVDRADHLADELNSMGVSAPVCLNDRMGGDVKENHPFRWNLLTGEWGYYESTERVRRIAEEYRERPVKRNAILAWNQFLLAFKRPSERLFRERGMDYEADYRDALNRPIRFRLHQLLK